MALVRKRDKSQRSEPAIFSAAPWAYLALDSKIYSKTVIFPCWSRMSMDRELFCMQHFCWMRENKTFDHIEAKCNPNIRFTFKILSFCLALDPKIHSKTANLHCWSRLFIIQSLHLTSSFWSFLTVLDPKTPSWTFNSPNLIRIFTRHVTYNQQSRTHQLAFWSVCHFIHPTKIFVFFNFVLGSIWQ